MPCTARVISRTQQVMQHDAGENGGTHPIIVKEGFETLFEYNNDNKVVKGILVNLHFKTA